MACIKTGAQVYITVHSLYLICDIHQFSGGLWVLRANPETSHQPIRDDLHATIHRTAASWGGTSNTFVVEYSDYTYHGYDGVPIAQS